MPALSHPLACTHPAGSYSYLVLDDGWSEAVRDADGRLAASRQRFPSGMKALADYLHSRGLKLGIYSDSGAWGPPCVAWEAGWQHEVVADGQAADSRQQWPVQRARGLPTLRASP